ncbi:MAG: hypothetical protein M1831_003551 [Alyxoria varia]|nr:MAG: hypothetical protein M1831_003551 [Alyxoria varia]
MPTPPIAIIAGVGPGTGASVARRFARSYPVALLARSRSSFQPLVEEINGSGGRAEGFEADVSDEESLKGAFREMESKFGGGGGTAPSAAAAVFNASGKFVRKSVLEYSVGDWENGLQVGVRGGFLFSQATLPLLLRHASDDSSKNEKQQQQHPPTLIFTGATASVKSNALMSAFSTEKYALRALSQSLAKEFGPKGVHVAHAIIDGVIDIEKTKHWMLEAGPDAKISPDAIAEEYWHLHSQHKSCFTQEIDIRPFCEKF